VSLVGSESTSAAPHFDRPARWQNPIEDIPVGFYVLRSHPDGRAVFEVASRSWLALLDLELEAVLADAELVFQAVHPLERTAMRQRHDACLSSGEPFVWEGRLLVRGQVRWVRIQAHPSPSVDGSSLWEGVMVDISDLKERALELRQGQAELTAILDDLPVAVAALSHDPDPRMLYVNRRYRATLGYGPEEVPTQAAWAALAFPDPQQRQQAITTWTQALERARHQSGSVESMELRLRAKDGAVLDVLVSATVLEELMLISLVDVTGQRRMEAELNQARRSLAETALSITEAIPVGTYTMVKRPDRELASFSFMSERFLEICGLDRQEARSDPLKGFACVHPDDFDAWVALNAHVFAHKLPFRGEARVIVNGEVRWILAESVPRDLPDGSTVWEGVIQDQTERVVAQQQREESEANLRRLLDNLPIPVGVSRFDADDQHSLVSLNRCFTETFGYDLAELGGLESWFLRAYPHPLRRRFYQERWRRDVGAAMAADGRVPAREYRVTTADGTRRDVLISAVTMAPLLVATFLDITERKRAQLDLALARRRERQLRRQQRQELEGKLRSSLTAAAMAHEIQQPLSTLIMGAQLALSSLERSTLSPDRELHSLLQMQLDQVQTLQATTEKMRALLRNVQTPHQPLRLTEIVESALLLLRRSLAQAGIAVAWDGLLDADWVAADAAQLQIAMANLLRNAIEALAESAVPEPRIVLCLRRDGDAVELEVGDNGPGFPPGMRLDLPLETTKERGMGIGLFVVRTTMENHAGALALGRSSLGGAAVTLRFRALPAPAARQRHLP
jgi:PAS domain S-box-containing protein